jgi:hypothetical protein
MDEGPGGLLDGEIERERVTNKTQEWHELQSYQEGVAVYVAYIGLYHEKWRQLPEFSTHFFSRGVEELPLGPPLDGRSFQFHVCLWTLLLPVDCLCSLPEFNPHHINVAPSRKMWCVDPDENQPKERLALSLSSLVSSQHTFRSAPLL